MSNLNMPNTTHAALTERFNRGGKTVRPLCYATTVERHAEDSRFFVIRQHGNTIAEVGPMELYVTDAEFQSFVFDFTSNVYSLNGAAPVGY